MLAIGQTLQNRYHISALLGQGGMGAVYRATDDRLQNDCVVKELVLQPGMTGQLNDAAAQFWQEARTLSRLSHPGLPRVTDYFEQDGAYFLVMDLVSGRNLQSIIGAGLPETV